MRYDGVGNIKAKLTLREGLPDIEAVERMSNKGNAMVCIDDLTAHVIEERKMDASLTQGSHLRHVFIIFISSSEMISTIALNTHYRVLFRNMRDTGQTLLLGRKIYPGNEGQALLDALRDVVN